MAMPIATLTGTSATGDITSGPGAPLCLVNAMPVSTMGDLVSGAACTGSITSTMSPTFLVGGIPVASQTCVVTGTNPATGAPVTTTEAVTVGVTFIV